MVKARTLWPGVESPPAPTGQGAEHPVYPCQSNCISSPDCHLLNDPSNNYYSHEIEAVVEEVDGVDTSYTAACAIRDAGSDTERLAIFFSSSLSDENCPESQDFMDLINEIRERVAQNVGVNPDYILPVSKGEIPKTAIGKIQHAQLKRGFEAGEFDGILRQIDIRCGNANTLPDWFYRKIWRRKEAMTYGAQPDTRQYLVFLDRLGLGTSLCAEWNAPNHQCVCVEAGEDFAKFSSDRYRINPKAPDHYRRLFDSMSEENVRIDVVLHLWTYDKSTGEITSLDALEEAQDRGVYSLLFLIQTLADVRSNESSVQLYVIGSHTQPTSPIDEIAIEKSPVLGLVKTIPQEMPWLNCRHVDLPVDRIEGNADHILREMQIMNADREVAYRSGQRLIPRLEKIVFHQDNKSLLQEARLCLTGLFPSNAVECIC